MLQHFARGQQYDNNDKIKKFSLLSCKTSKYPSCSLQMLNVLLLFPFPFRNILDNFMLFQTPILVVVHIVLNKNTVMCTRNLTSKNSKVCTDILSTESLSQLDHN